MTDIEWYKNEAGSSYISLGKYRIGLSKGLFDDMGRPKYVQLGYQDKEKLLLIKLCDENGNYSVEVKSGKYPAKINSKGFIRFIKGKGIKVEDKPRRYRATWDEKNKIAHVSCSG